MVDSDQQKSASANIRTSIRANSQAFIFNLKKTDFTIKKATKAFLLENDCSIFYLETTNLDVTRVLSAQILINLKEDKILKENLNEILFSDFSSFTTFSPEENQDFLINFPDLFVCTFNNEEVEEQLEKHSSLVESWIKTIKVNGKKIIFILKNSQHLEKLMMNSEMANIFKLKLDQLWEENEMESNKVICAIQSNVVKNESISARALDECTNINLETEASSEETTSDDKAAAENADLTNLLQSLGVGEIDAVDEDGDTQLHLAARDGKLEIVQSLLSHRAKNDVKNNIDQTALHLAVEKGHSAIVHVLVEHGFDVNAIDNHQCTPLHYACEYHNDPHLVELLLKFGADIETKSIFGRTALHLASIYGRSAVVNSLLKNGANINVQDDDGDTSLHRATYGNYPEVVSILLQHGALLNNKNDEQKTAIDLARIWNRTEIIKIFENFK